jgi:hypothetical protein
MTATTACLRLSAQTEFAELATVFIDKLVSEAHAFFTNGGQVDTIKWKHTKQTENAAVDHGRGLGETALIVKGSGKRDTHRLLHIVPDLGQSGELMAKRLQFTSCPVAERILTPHDGFYRMPESLHPAENGRSTLAWLV